MMFIDTSAFLAIENREDSYHESSLAFRDACLKSRRVLVTSDYVLDESYTIIRLRAGHDIAVQFGEALRSSQFIRIEHVTPELIEKAWKIFKTYGDHDFSFTDCTSFAIMKDLNIKTAFAFDAHFREFGEFTVQP
jgi:predicted nucleic acid-binding protein